MNKMGENNLAIIFSPVLGTSSDVIIHFILEYDQIFPPSDQPKLPPEWPNVNFSKVEVVPISQMNTKTGLSHSVPPKTNHVPMPSSKARPQPSVGGASNGQSSLSSSAPSSSPSPSSSSSVPPKTNHVPMPVQKKYSSSGLNATRSAASTGHLTVNHAPMPVTKTNSSSGFGVPQKSQPRTPIKLPPPPSQSSPTLPSPGNSKRPQAGASPQPFQPPQKPLPQQKKALPTPPAQPKGQGGQQVRPVTGTQTLRRPLPQKKETFY